MKRGVRWPWGTVRQQGRKAMRRQRPVPALPNLASAELYTDAQNAAPNGAGGLPACSRAMGLRAIEATASLHAETAEPKPDVGINIVVFFYS